MRYIETCFILSFSYTEKSLSQEKCFILKTPLYMSHFKDRIFPHFGTHNLWVNFEDCIFFVYRLWVTVRTVYLSLWNHIFSANRPYIFKIWRPYIFADRIFFAKGPYIFSFGTIYFQPGPRSGPYISQLTPIFIYFSGVVWPILYGCSRLELCCSIFAVNLNLKKD